VTRVHTVLGGGISALACALFAARHGPVRLLGRPGPTPRSTVESVPAATLTLLLELGITPAELDVGELTRERTVAWDAAAPSTHTGPACAHIDRVALQAALWRRALAEPAISVLGRVDPADVGGCAGPGCVDATGRRAVTASAVLRPPRTWTAATVTVPTGGADRGLRLAAAPEGYAYRLGSTHWTTLGWVGPDRPPRDPVAICRRIGDAGAGWLLADLVVTASAPTHRRPAGLALPVACGRSIPIGDAALTRDALASQGISIGLSDACLAAATSATSAASAARRVDAVRRHVRHLSGMVAVCRFAAAPAWAQYRDWLSGTAAREEALDRPG
jgi:2-polyprenyl-6-methoxyphenol hydroxylase-like FAD-dependent oxidoreductase